MGGPGKKNWIIQLVALLLFFTMWGLSAQAETHLSGTVGADLGIYEFTNSIFDPPLAFQADRRLSNQYLDLSINGPVVNDHFANYLARVRFQGTQVKAGTEESSTYEYIDPGVTSYFGSFSLFTDRRYPVKLYSGKNKVNSVRYEAGNRSEIEMVDQGLAVVRRYETITEATGIQLKYSLNQGPDLSFEAKTTANQRSRMYDFDENRNIWVDFWEKAPGVAPYYNIDVENFILDHDVLLYVGGAFIDTIPAGGQVDIVVEEGMRDFDFIPVGLNSFRRSLDVDSDMGCNIFFNDPPGSKDLDQTNNIVTGKLKYEGDGPFKTEAKFEIDSGSEDVQDMVTNLKVFNNLAGYEINPNASVQMLSNYSSNLIDVGDISHQLSTMFMNQTTGRWSQKRGMRATVTHSFFNLSSETGTDQVKSTNNIVNALLNIPTGWNRHETDFLVNSNILSDSKDFKNSLYFTEMRNQLELRNLGFRWRPKHQVKYSKGKQENPDATNSEWDNKFLLDGENPRLGMLGALKVKGEYSLRHRNNARGNDTSKKYLSEVVMVRKFVSGYRLKLGAGWEKEAFDSEINQDLVGPVRLPKRTDETRRSYRIDIQTKPFAWMDLGGNAMRIKTNESKITKFSASLSVKIPKIKIPVKSFLLKERRELEGVRPQEWLRVETKSSYNFRKIRLVLAHQYTDETLLTENYTYNEFSIKIFRDFDIF